MNRRAFLAASLTVPARAAAQARQAGAPAPTVPPFRLPDNVEMRRGLAYARYQGNRELRLDLFLPKERPAAPMPAIVYIHGGGWRNGNRSAFHRQAAHMATLGYAGACIEYRLSGEATWPAAIHDAKAAVRWVRSQAAGLGIDPRRIGAAGGSAGGHLAALLGTTSHRKDLEGPGGHAKFSSRVRAVAAFNPAVDLVSFGKQAGANLDNSIAAFLGKSYAEAPALWELATPLLHVSARSAAFLFLHGSADVTVPIQQSLDMQARLQAAGVVAEFFPAEGATHGFFNRPPWFEPTLQRMAGFFDAHLKPDSRR